MNKKSIFLSICLITLLSIKAQITSVEYPSGYLSEEKIAKILQKSRKSGTQEWELQKQNEILHRQLEKQNEVIANGAYSSSNQKIIQAPPQVMTGCVNAGFETGATNGWAFTQGSNNTGQNLPCPTCFTGGAGGVYEITSANATSNVNNNAGNNTGGDVSTTCNCSPTDCTPEPYSNGVDRFGGFPVVAPSPFGGMYSLMLNNSNCGFLMQRASYSFLVDATNSSFTYQVAIVLQDGGHTLTQSPYFSVNVTDITTNSLVPCAQYSVQGSTSGNLAGWSTSSVDASVHYKPWQTVTTDLSAVIGHTVSLTFDVSDCNQGGHFGYAYIDAGCNSSQIISSNTLCMGGTTTLSGPPGMATYSWTGPATGASQNLVTSTPGNYTLATTSASGCSSPTLYYNLTQSSASSPTISIQVLKDTICSGATTTLTASGASTYVWSNNANGSSITVSPTTNTTYSVTGTDGSGCVDTSISKIINVLAHHVSIQATQDSVCPGAADVLTASGANTYTWSSNTGSATTNTVMVTSLTNDTYTVVGVNNNGCVDSTTKTILIKNCSTTAIHQLAIGNNQVSVYPNPANEMLYIECTFKNATLFISDILGNKIKQVGTESELTTVDISSLNNGVYFLSVKTANNVITKRFIVQR
ncbi:MAG: T9SS type A sorting domain-containing protein [Bacteroidia bacterium]